MKIIVPHNGNDLIAGMRASLVVDLNVEAILPNHAVVWPELIREFFEKKKWKVGNAKDNFHNNVTSSKGALIHFTMP